MIYKIMIPERFASLNEYIKALGRHPIAGNQMKQRDEQICVVYLRKYLKSTKIEKPIIIHYNFYEPNTKRSHEYS